MGRVGTGTGWVAPAELSELVHGERQPADPGFVGVQAWDGTGWDGMGRSRSGTGYVMGRSGIGWDGMEWDGILDSLEFVGAQAQVATRGMAR